MSKLNDTQLVILNAAVLREDLGVAQIDRRAVTKDAITALLKIKHLKTVPRVPGLTAWKDDAGEAHSLVATSKALKALGIEVAAPASTVVNIAPPEQPKLRSRKTDAPAAPAEASPAAGGSKLAAVIALMRRPEGATISDLMAATNWQAHSVRGAISGALKKKQGLAVISERVGDTRSYRIA